MNPALDVRLFDPSRTNLLVGLAIFLLFLVLNISRARAGAAMFIRPMAGLKAVEEAIGRATEMGRPVLYVPGLGDMSEVGTLASITILSRVARRTAEMGCDLEVPGYDPVAATIMEGAVRQAYIEAGRGDAFRPGSVHYVSAQQFAYVAAVTGYMLRARPATNIFMGSFYAESLFLAETGNLTGAIQIAGTDQVTQLPFFVCACDYTLLGEELYAASAYLSREPVLLGSIRGQDIYKALCILVGLTGIAFATFGSTWIARILQTQ
jgi:hypothetical protein